MNRIDTESIPNQIGTKPNQYRTESIPNRFNTEPKRYTIGETINRYLLPFPGLLFNSLHRNYHSVKADKMIIFSHDCKMNLAL